jgi:hypothetical protein
MAKGWRKPFSEILVSYTNGRGEYGTVWLYSQALDSRAPIYYTCVVLSVERRSHKCGVFFSQVGDMELRTCIGFTFIATALLNH